MHKKDNEDHSINVVTFIKSIKRVAEIYFVVFFNILNILNFTVSVYIILCMVWKSIEIIFHVMHQTLAD